MSTPRIVHGDVRCARGIAACDGRQSLHMRTEKLGERLGLRLTQLRELRRDVGDWAMMLAQLLASACLRCRGSITLPAQGGSQHLGPCLDIGLALDRFPVRADELGNALLGERAYRALPAVLGEKPQRRSSEIIVCVPEPGAAHIGEQEQFRRTAPAPANPSGSIPRLGLTVGQQRIQMSAHRCRADTEIISHCRSCDGTLLEQQPGDLVPRAAIVCDLRGPADIGVLTCFDSLLATPRYLVDGSAFFHNTSVSYFHGQSKVAAPRGDLHHDRSNQARW